MCEKYLTNCIGNDPCNERRKLKTLPSFVQRKLETTIEILL